jgi:hypothetical protein
VIYTKDANGNLHHEFFDFFSEAPHDFEFTYEALERLGRTVDFTYFKDGVHFWGDNAFKTYAILYIFYVLADKWAVPISASFFAPHHGWSLCDTHFGHTKKKLRQEFRTSLITEISDITDVFRQFSNVTVEILDTIQEREVDTQFFKFKEGGISQYYHFDFSSPTEVTASVMTGINEKVELDFNK